MIIERLIPQQMVNFLCELRAEAMKEPLTKT